MLWGVIGEPRGGYSRLRNRAPRKDGFAWWSCGQKELEGDLFPSRVKEASAQSTLTVDGSASVRYK